MNTLQRTALLSPFLTLTILSLPPSSTLRKALYPLPALLFLHPIVSPPKFLSTDKEAVEEAFKLGTLSASFAFMFTYFLYSGYNTPSNFYKVPRGKEGYPDTIWGRVKWSLSLITALRGVGWNFEVSNLPRRVGTREGCIRRAIAAILGAHGAWYAAGKLCGAYARLLRDEHAAEKYGVVYKVFGNILVQMGVVSAAWGVRNIAFVVLVSSSLELFFVASGVGGERWSDPGNWVRMFGYPQDCWSVKNVWGRVWHQSIRRCIQFPGDKIASVIFGKEYKSLPQPAKAARAFFLLLSAFSISGLIHVSGSYFIVAGMDSPPPSTDQWYYTFYFFIAQAIFVAMEEVVCYALGVGNTPQEVRVGGLRWMVGVVYTTMWFCWCTPVLWADPESRVVGFVGGVGEEYAHVFDRIDRF
ncbi:hypothetical protein TWF481_008783 [Arthrobotrys musiformis]|uniref:Wax synthase domain-containing protein n=1 Tax=Arthrobotrys musiformis TaxID=47236 RepID=A0AAV9WA27_9PEZI